MNIGFISFRLAGTDGVSLESAKWAEVLSSMGHRIFYFAGELDPPGEQHSLLKVQLSGSRLVPRSHFTHPSINWITIRSFESRVAHQDLRIRMERLTRLLKRELEEFISEFEIELIIIQNVFALSLNLPLSMALRRLIYETEIPTIAHNHDFWWERERFAVTCVDDILISTFPPQLPSIHQVVINTNAQKKLAGMGIKSTYVPNVFDYNGPPPGIDDFNADLRAEIGLEEDELFFLQPTRVVQRKGIELAIELVSRLDDLPIKLVITHHAEYDTLGYLEWIQALAARSRVNMVYLPMRFAPQRQAGEGIDKIYSLWDAYVHADFITYPSLIEGFGNALLETLYFRKPLLVNRYPIYREDIEPLGFDILTCDGEITDQTVAAVRALLTDPDRIARMTTHNAEIAQMHFSYQVLRQHLEELLAAIR